jgi:single-strand DNA-binding protein
MPALNRVELIGYLGRDPETRSTPKGTPYCQFTVAVNRPRRASDAPDKADNADWFNIQAWGKLAAICQQYLSKGRLIFVEGRMHTNKWTDDKGETHYFSVVVANRMQMLDRKPGEHEVVGEGEEAAE